MNNKMILTAISFLANFIMAGFATQFGLLVEPIANAFNANINEVASIFSLFHVSIPIVFFLCQDERHLLSPTQSLFKQQCNQVGFFPCRAREKARAYTASSL